jgi:hypothetical protein
LAKSFARMLRVASTPSYTWIADMLLVSGGNKGLNIYVNKYVQMRMGKRGGEGWLAIRAASGKP